MKLSDLTDGMSGMVVRVRGRSSFRRRIMEMGFIKGRIVTVVKNAPLKDPVEYQLMNYHVSLRRRDAAMIEVHPLSVATESSPQLKATPSPMRKQRRFRRGLRRGAPECQLIEGDMPKPACRRDLRCGMPCIRVALVGNPNSGKTTIFNCLSESAEHVGNWGGVTVQAKSALVVFRGYLFEITDLPGTYSLTEYTPEEIFVREHIINSTPDIIINIVDATNIERNAYLTVQLLELNVPILIALNMYDELEARGDHFDHRHLGAMLGVPIVPTIGVSGRGIPDLLAAAINVYERCDETVRSINISYGPDIERSIERIQGFLQGLNLQPAVSPRYAAIKLLEKDSSMRSMIARFPSGESIIEQTDREIRTLEYELKEDIDALIADARYGFIAGALKETLRPASQPTVSTSDVIDRFLTHKILGIPIFLLFLWVAFTLTYVLGDYPKTWLEEGTALIAQWLAASMPEGILRELLTDGIVAGAGGVLVFLPNILILFFIISMMEDSGYMARVSFIMDRLMHAIGLHGKAFIPLVLGFGCNVPAVMATRTLESRNDRLLTMLIVPFMSCSARLPVYVLLVGAFFPARAGTVIFLLYLGGILIGILSSMILKRVLFRSAEAPFVMELPPYRMPRLKNTLRHMWERALEYLKKIGGIVLIASILIWALGRFPDPPNDVKSRDAAVRTINHNEALSEKESAVPGEDDAREVEAKQRIEHSYIARLGKAIHPILEPLGFDWRMSVSIISGLAAKEVVVSTMGILYHADPHARVERSMGHRLSEIRYEDGERKGQPVFTTPTVISFLVFILLYIPCFATLMAIRREAGSWRWALFSAVFSTSVAWVISFAVYRVALMVW